MSWVVYGIPNCDQVRATRQWLRSHGIDHRFHDLRRDGIDAALIQHWLQTCDWTQLLNRRGTTWRQLPEAERQSIQSADAAVALMLAHPTVIRRPVVERTRSPTDAAPPERATAPAVQVGFDPVALAALAAHPT